MSARSVLCVTGARALANNGPGGGSLASERWARTQLWRVIEACERNALLLTGGCRRSPDEWAREVAEETGRDWIELRASGWRVSSLHKPRAWFEGEQRLLSEPRFPLFRNWVMVGALVHAREQGAAVHMVAFCAPWSPTKGTLQTARLAQEAGLTVTVLEAEPWRRGDPRKAPAHEPDTDERQLVLEHVRATTQTFRATLADRATKDSAKPATE